MRSAPDNPTSPYFSLGTRNHWCMTATRVHLRLPVQIYIGEIPRPHSVPCPGWIPLLSPSWVIASTTQLAYLPWQTRPSALRLQHLWCSPLLRQVRCASNPQGVQSVPSARTPANATTSRRAIGAGCGARADDLPPSTHKGTRGPSRERKQVITRHKRDHKIGCVATDATRYGKLPRTSEITALFAYGHPSTHEIEPQRSQRSTTALQ